MSVHVSPATSTVRWYSAEGGYERREPYEAVCTIQWIGDDTVYLSGLHGRMTPAFWRELNDVLHARGIKDVLMERRNRRVVGHTAEPSASEA